MHDFDRRHDDTRHRPVAGGAVPMLRVMQLGAHVLFVALLAVGTVRMLTTTQGAHRWWIVVLVVAELGWYTVGVVVATRARARPRPLGPAVGRWWFAVLVSGWLLLIVADHNFVWLGFALYFLCFHLLPVPQALAATVVLTGAEIAGSVGHGVPNTEASILGPVIGAAVAACMAMVYQQLAREAAERELLVDELTTAHRELLDAQDELALLQRESGALAERSRLARDIHDTLAQGFSSILLLARAGRQQDPSTPIFAQIADTAQENLVEARRVVAALAPADLESAPLESALRRLLARLTDETGIAGELLTDGEPVTLPMEYDVALLRVAQSALANVRLHSQARRVRLTLSCAADEVRLDIVDDGVGFGFDQPEAGGFGLRAMRDRLGELGGALVVESAPGDGTAVAATLPVGRVP